MAEAERKGPMGIHGGQPRPRGGWLNACAKPRRSRAKHRDRPLKRLDARRAEFDAMRGDNRGRRRPGSLSGRK